MRDAFCRALVAQASRADFVFLTGDLGFQALEPLRDALGPRFLNAGVAEQNMISVAAGMAKTGLRPWVYSIAPFLYARPFEQIRNDVCLHGLPVALVGNGGGYGYGVMGATHHALEDYGTLLTLPGMRAAIPAFDSDLEPIASTVMSSTHPWYIRLGRSEAPRGYEPPPFAKWRHLLQGGGPVILAAGPIAGGILAKAQQLPEQTRPSIWLVSELPLGELPSGFLREAALRPLIVVEEHVAQGGLGQALSHALLSASHPVARFVHRHALGYVSGRYGSQAFHREESGLSAEQVLSLCEAAASQPNTAAAASLFIQDQGGAPPSELSGRQ